MTNTITLYKNTYIIDMDRVLQNRMTWTILGAGLPVIEKNSQPEDSIKALSGRFVEKMIKNYEQLSKLIGKTDASTIIEYLDTNGRPVITLYPTNDVDVHNTDWSNLAPSAIADLQRIHNERALMVHSARHKSK